MFGTFLLVLAGAGAAVVGAATHGHIGRAASVVAPALMVATAGLWASPISGASMSPARSLGPREGCWSQVSPRRRPPHCVRSRQAARRRRRPRACRGSGASAVSYTHLRAHETVLDL